MIILDQKYRIWWDSTSLDIQNDYQIDYSGSITKIINPSDTYVCFQSDNYQDILDKINEFGLHPLQNAGYEDI